MRRQFSHNYTLFKVLFWCWLVILTSLLLMPGSEVSKLSIFKYEHIDKVIHFVAMCGSSVLLMLATKTSPGRRINLLILAGYCIGVEFLQAAVATTRSFEWEDIIANLFGLLVGYGIYLIFQRTFKI